MTSSIYIIDVVSENALACTPTPTFATSEQWEQNLKDNATLPLVFLERPIIEKGKLVGQGTPEGVFPLSIYFIGARQDLLDPQANIEAALKLMRDLCRQFLLRLGKERRVRRVIDYNTVELSFFLDLTASAIWLKVSITIEDTGAICLT